MAESSTGSPTDPWSVVLYSSWKGIVFTLLGAGIFLAFALYLVVAVALNVLTGVLAAIAVGAALVVLLDMPTSVEFSDDGIVRRALLRHERLGWERVDRLQRNRSGVVRTRKSGGGLIARVGKRQYALVDVMESRLEYDELRRRLGRRGELLGLTDALRPGENRPPTWRYRRRVAAAKQ